MPPALAAVAKAFLDFKEDLVGQNFTAKEMSENAAPAELKEIRKVRLSIFLTLTERPFKD